MSLISSALLPLLQDGQIEDDLALRQAIFFGGVEPQLRANVWPFLLHYYDFRTTFLERQAIMEEKHQLYHKIKWVTQDQILKHFYVHQQYVIRPVVEVTQVFTGVFMVAVID